MKNVKRILVFVMAVIMLSSVSVPIKADAAGKTKLTSKKIALTITNKKTKPTKSLRIKNSKAKRVKWKISDSSVATLKITGMYKVKVIGKKAGKTTITCKVKGKKYTCKVTVKDKRKKKTTKPNSKVTDKTPDSKTPDNNTPNNETPKTPNNETPKCSHETLAEVWRYHETTGDYTGEVYPCSCGQVFSSRDEYEKHVGQIIIQQSLEKQTGCHKRAPETGLHGTRASYTPKISEENGITHVTIGTCYIEYMYCVECGEKVSFTWDLPQQ